MKMISSAADLELVNCRLEALVNNGRVTHHENSRMQRRRNVAPCSGRAPGSMVSQGANAKATDRDQAWLEERWPEKSFPLIREALNSTRRQAQEIPILPQSREKGVSDIQPGEGFDLYLVSPNSQIPCDARDCPITGPHNLGKYFHDGKQPRTPEEWDYKTSTGLTMAPVSHFFNYTVPPPFIEEAYIRMTEHKASRLDQDLVRNYQMNHMYSPLVSETPTPRARSESTSAVPILCSIVEPEAASQRHKLVISEQLKLAESGETQVREAQQDLPDSRNKYPLLQESQASPKNFNMMRDVRQPLMKKLRLSRKEKLVSRVHIVDFDAANKCGLNDEDHVSARDHERGNRQSNDQEAAPIRNAQILTGPGPCGRSSAREIPQGFKLEQVQLNIQEDILHEIAHEAIDEAYSHPDLKHRGKKSNRNSFKDTESPEDQDRELEIVSELMKKLRGHLNDRTFQDLYLVDREGKDETCAAKLAIIQDIQMILRRAFRVRLAKFARPYRPTGLPVVDQEMEGEFESQLAVREALMQQYPNLTIKEMVRSLDHIGHGADMQTMAGM